MNEERHEYWGPTPESDEHVFGSDELRSRFYLLGGLNLACLLALVIGVSVLGQRGFTPPVFIGQSHGLFFSGKNDRVNSIDWEADMRQQFIDTAEVLFLRTEKGALPDLKNFVEQSVLDQVEKGYRNGSEKLKPGFAQTFTVLEARNAPSPGKPIIRQHMTGVLSSRGLDGSQSSTIYLQCDFAPRGSNPDNVTGWKLTSITRIREDEYFSEEREKERIRRLGLEEDGPTITPTPSPKK